MIKEIRILIADDHQIVSDGLKNILKDIEGLKVVASASNGEEAVEMASSKRYDMILMDIRSQNYYFAKQREISNLEDKITLLVKQLNQLKQDEPGQLERPME